MKKVIIIERCIECIHCESDEDGIESDWCDYMGKYVPNSCKEVHVDCPLDDYIEPKKIDQPDLLHCPFCKKDVELFQREKDNEYSWDIRCNFDKCWFVEGSDWWLSKEDAILMWNRREM